MKIGQAMLFLEYLQPGLYFFILKLATFRIMSMAFSNQRAEEILGYLNIPIFLISIYLLEQRSGLYWDKEKHAASKPKDKDFDSR